MPHNGRTLEIKTVPKRFRKDGTGKVLHLPTHDTTSKIHTMSQTEKKQKIQNAYLGVPVDAHHLSQVAN